MNESKNLLAIDSESLNLQTSHVFVLQFELLLNSYFLPMIRSHPYQERVARQWLCIEITINLPKKRWSSNRLHACFSYFTLHVNTVFQRFSCFYESSVWNMLFVAEAVCVFLEL